MSFWTAIFGIVVVACLAGIINSYLHSKNPRGNRLSQERLDKLGADLTELRERVKTLERIATDKPERLRQEFAELDRS